jgi:predicted  nucleic acid-binding Zn-ribbon protein
MKYAELRAEIRELREHVERLQQRLAAARERYVLESEDLRQRYEALVDHCTMIAATQTPTVIAIEKGAP